MWKFLSGLLSNAVGSLVALVGTLLVALLGYRQWKTQQASTKSAAFFAERRQAYKELWQKLEAVHLSVRSRTFSEQKFNQLVRAANTHVIKAGLYLDLAEKKRVNDYMTSLGKLGMLLVRAKSEDATREACSTTTFSPDVLEKIEGLQAAYNTVEEQRNLLIAHFREILGADI